MRKLDKDEKELKKELEYQGFPKPIHIEFIDVLVKAATSGLPFDEDWGMLDYEWVVCLDILKTRTKEYKRDLRLKELLTS